LDTFVHVSPFQLHVSPRTFPAELYPPNSKSVVGPEPETNAIAASERAEGVEAGCCGVQPGPWNSVFGDDPEPSGLVTPPIVVVPIVDGPIPPIAGRVTVITAPACSIGTDATKSDTDSPGPDGFTGAVTAPGGGGRSFGALAACLAPGRASWIVVVPDADGEIPANRAAMHAKQASTAIVARTRQ
jgi:hypothetical protein